LILVGSGNGACGFLSKCLKHLDGNDLKILVLEQGRNFSDTSNITLHTSWPHRTYAPSTNGGFQLHNCKTPKGRAIISGRAKIMGGGSSINYSMIHESSQWVGHQMGYDISYWEMLKTELNDKFKRPDPFFNQNAFSEFIQKKAHNPEDDTAFLYALPKREHLIKNIPSLQDEVEESCPTKEGKQLYVFPTQFDTFGVRKNSGVSIVDWQKVTLIWDREVTRLVMDGATCTKVKVKLTASTRTHEEYNIRPGGRVILDLMARLSV
jgi:choline dehydrogenase-like flavoprotein